MEIDLNANFEFQYHETIDIRTKYLGVDLEGLFFSVQRQVALISRLLNRKNNCILQIHRINAVVTSIMTIIYIQKRIELDRYIVQWAVTVLNRKANNKNPKPNKLHKNTKNQHDRWSTEQFTSIWSILEEIMLLYYLRNWYGKRKQERNNKTPKIPYNNLWTGKQQGHNAETKAPPSKESRDHRVQALRATFSQILWYDPKTSNDTAMWQMESRNGT